MLNIKKYRISMGLSLNKLSKQTGYSRQYISALEANEYTNPTLDVICCMCKVFCISPNELIPEEMYK